MVYNRFTRWFEDHRLLLRGGCHEVLTIKSSHKLGRTKAGSLTAFGLAVILTTSSYATSLDRIKEPLASKARQILVMCSGSRVISGYRRTFIVGTRHLSLHSKGRAVDIIGDYKCIVRQLDGWPGGFTTDYYKMKHIHISYGGPEHGLRFVHGSGRRRIQGLRRMPVSAVVRNDKHRVQ